MDALFSVHDWERAKAIADACKEKLGTCIACKRKSRRIHDCTDCLAVMFATAMTEARMGLDEMKRIQREGRFVPVADIDAMAARIAELEDRLRAAGVETGGD